jgi:hypothetical protein
MENLSELSGYVASTLVLFTFVVKDMRLLRTVAIFSNLAFITYGTIEWLPPVLFLHMVLLPLNAVRLAEVVRATQAKGDLIQTDGVPSGKDPACLPPRLAQAWFALERPRLLAFRALGRGIPQARRTVEIGTRLRVGT